MRGRLAMKKGLVRIFQIRIDGLDFILYASGKCRVDDNTKHETQYFEGGERTKWWKLFKSEAERNNIHPNIIDTAFGAWLNPPKH